MDNFNTHIEIEKYLSGEFTSEEKLAFEEKLAQNKELQELVDDYSLANDVIMEAELISVKSKLQNIHAQKQLRQKVTFALAFIALVVIGAIAFYTYNSISSDKAKKVILLPKNAHTQINLPSHPTPLTTIDSMTDIELTKTLKESKEKQEAFPLILDSVKSEKNIPTKKPDTINREKAENIAETPKTKKPEKGITTPADSTTPEIKCNLTLTQNDVITTNSCSEKGTGSIEFVKRNENYRYRINERNTFSKRVKFDYLPEGYYQLAIQEKACTSNTVEVYIESFQCNFVIHPDQFVYFEKSLEDFVETPEVEVFIFNKNGIIVYNKKLLTSQLFEWKGESNRNSQLPMGNYTYLIKGGLKIAKGEITVIR